MAAVKYIVIAVALLVVAVAGYSYYGAQQTRVQREAILKGIGETTVQLREVLAKTPSAELVARIEASLQAIKSPRNRELADAAELYVVSAREIARRRVDAARLSAEAAASRRALAMHMAHQNRASSWYRDATTLKEKVEREHADLARTLKALDELLGSMPDAERRLAGQIPASLLLEAALREAARKQAAEEAKQAVAELEKARSLAPR